MAKKNIDHFTKQQFEDALPRHKTTGRPLCTCAGLIDGEYVYQLPVGGENSKVIIEIRSSVDAMGHSADTGENSIRAYLIYFDHNADGGKGAWRPLGSKVQKYVTRLPGWQYRLTEMLRTLYAWRNESGNCKVCGMPLHIFKVTKDGPNKGRVYAKCMTHNQFRWVTAVEEKDTK
jgi:hypothetical protein